MKVARTSLMAVCAQGSGLRALSKQEYRSLSGFSVTEEDELERSGM